MAAYCRQRKSQTSDIGCAFANKARRSSLSLRPWGSNSNVARMPLELGVALNQPIADRASAAARLSFRQGSEGHVGEADRRHLFELGLRFAGQLEEIDNKSNRPGLRAFTYASLAHSITVPLRNVIAPSEPVPKRARLPRNECSVWPPEGDDVVEVLGPGWNFNELRAARSPVAFGSDPGARALVIVRFEILIVVEFLPR